MQQQCSLAMLTLFQSPKRFIRMVLLRFIFLGEGKDVFSLAARKKEEEVTIESKSDSIFVMISLFFFKKSLRNSKRSILSFSLVKDRCS